MATQLTTSDFASAKRPTTSLRRSKIALSLTILVVAAASTMVTAEDGSPCVSIQILRPADSKVIFADGFELADIDNWIASTATLSATEIIDVVFTIHIEGAIVGDHLLELRTSTQDGHLYQVLTEPITTDLNRDGAIVEVLGFPHPVRLQGLRSSDGANRSDLMAVVRLPVAGTSIVTSSLYGSWEVSAYLDGVLAGCSDPSRFTLVQ